MVPGRLVPGGSGRVGTAAAVLSVLVMPLLTLPVMLPAPRVLDEGLPVRDGGCVGRLVFVGRPVFVGRLVFVGRARCVVVLVDASVVAGDVADGSDVVGVVVRVVVRVVVGSDGVLVVFVLDALSLVMPVAAGGVADRVLDGTDPVPRVVASDVLCGAGTQRVPVQTHWLVLRVETRVESSLRDAEPSRSRDVRSDRSDEPSPESEAFADEKGRSPDEVDPTRLVLLLVAISPASPDAVVDCGRPRLPTSPRVTVPSSRNPGTEVPLTAAATELTEIAAIAIPDTEATRRTPFSDRPRRA